LSSRTSLTPSSLVTVSHSFDWMMVGNRRAEAPGNNVTHERSLLAQGLEVSRYASTPVTSSRTFATVASS